MESERFLYRDLDRILYTEAELHESVRQLGKRITHDYQGKKPLFVCILKGASVFFCDLIREVDVPLEIDFMSCSSYQGSVTSGDVRVHKDLDQSIVGRDVIIVEDIVDTGTTLTFIKKLLNSRGASSLRIACLLDKPSRRKTPLSVDYYCFEVPNEFVVGYGLDYNGWYRNLPDIGVLSPHIYAVADEDEFK